ncbi:hypothetical protein [Lactiplantibacillus plantarum]|uniref:hypothetical protein n=1 Tax=Lactiplantibacillus plantarum TaxID=1590 RepID=UPI0007B5579F|nr:hypothetical protein [Lactiplantibacillus plantarum]KZU26982.1 hypothetical protein Nizo2535_2748 [Lactiplantibacillus plantarum]KZU76458.1 hypothetical protein Nizo2891_2563 [Lactiplantibacillus plantarum]
MPEQTIEDVALEIEIKYKTALSRHKISQKEMAEMLTTKSEKVAPSQVNRAIKGGNEPKSVSIRKRMSEILGIQ